MAFSVVVVGTMLAAATGVTAATVIVMGLSPGRWVTATSATTCSKLAPVLG